MARPRKPRDRDPAWVAVGHAITSRRVELGMRHQSDLAEKAELTSKTIGELERGDRASYEGSTLAAVEQALQWPAGQIRAIVTGRAVRAYAGSAEGQGQAYNPRIRLVQDTVNVPDSVTAQVTPGPLRHRQELRLRLQRLLGDDSPLPDEDLDRLVAMLSLLADQYERIADEQRATG